MFIAQATNCRWQLLRASPRYRTRAIPYQFFIVVLDRSTPERTLEAVVLNHFCQFFSGLLRWAL
jgi:hypothetical protein